jgi:tetratricopeptide (TPR) repeat protein
VKSYYERIDRGAHNEMALVFVHGLFGDYQETWGKFPDLVLVDSTFYQYDFIYWGYPTRLLPNQSRFLSWVGRWLPGIGNRLPDIASLASALAADLNNLEIAGSYKRIVLIGHSMGGLIIKKMIIKALCDLPEKTELLNRIEHLVFFATPSDGVQLPALLSAHPQAKDIQCDGEAINDLRNEWIKRVHGVRIDDALQSGKRFISTTAILGLEDNAVSHSSAASFYADVKTVQGNHCTICKPNRREDTVFQILRAIVLDVPKLPVIIEKTASDIIALGISEAPAVPVATPESSQRQELSVVGRSFDLAEKEEFSQAYRLLVDAFSKDPDPYGDNMMIPYAIYHLYDKGWAGGFGGLKQFATDNPTVPDAFLWLGIAYERVEDWEQAITCFMKRRSLCSSPSEKLHATIRLSKTFLDADREDEALAELRGAFENAKDPPERADLMKALGYVLIKVRKGDPTIGAACYTKSLALMPGDKSLRFDLAYKHGGAITPAEVLHHYLRILEQGSDQYAANNAGVAAEKLELPFTAIDYLKQSADQNNTLAMANMAGSLITAGFEKLGKEILNNAKQQAEVNDSVDLRLAQIVKQRKSEQEKLVELESQAQAIIKWRCQEAEAIARKPAQPQAICGVYAGVPGSLISITSGIDGIILGTSQANSDGLTFTGRIEGGLLMFSWNTVQTEQKSTSPFTILGGIGLGFSSSRKGKGALIIENHGKLLRGYRVAQDEPLKPIEWTLRQI